VRRALQRHRVGPAASARLAAGARRRKHVSFRRRRAGGCSHASARTRVQCPDSCRRCRHSPPRLCGVRAQSIKVFRYQSDTGTLIADSARTLLELPLTPPRSVGLRDGEQVREGGGQEGADGGETGTESKREGEGNGLSQSAHVYGQLGGAAVDEDGHLWVPLDAFHDCMMEGGGKEGEEKGAGRGQSQVRSPSGSDTVLRKDGVDKDGVVHFQGRSSSVIKVHGVTGEVCVCVREREGGRKGGREGRRGGGTDEGTER
jgi:hypothetical protein